MADAFKTFLVVNPRAGGGAGRRRFARIARAVGAVVGEFDHAFTEGPGHATLLTRKALEAGFELVVGVGGDGTFNEVANGFFEGDRPIRPDAVFGVLPQGTGGDLRRTLEVPRDLDEAASWLAGRAVRPLDVGHLTFLAHDGSPAERVFVNISSFGVGGVVVDRVNRTSKVLGGRASFTIGSLRGLMAWHDRPVSLSVDGGPPETMPITNVAVCNGQYFGGGMWVAPDARTDDGRFEVTVWAGYGLKDFVFKGRMIYDGTHRDDPRTRTFQASRLTAEPVEGEDLVLLDVDGEQPGRLPATFRVLPAALRLKVAPPA